MLNKLTALMMAGFLALGASLSACTDLVPNVVKAEDAAAPYQARIQGACSVALALGPVVLDGAYPWVWGGCATEQAVASLASDPTSLAWLQGIVDKAHSAPQASNNNKVIFAVYNSAGMPVLTVK